MNEYFILDKALSNTRRSLVDICAEFNINIENIDINKLENYSCCNCGIWGRNHTHEDGLPICHFCNDIDSLRF